jgi:single-stranded DNA-binding protein
LTKLINNIILEGKLTRDFEYKIFGSTGINTSSMMINQSKKIAGKYEPDNFFIDIKSWTSIDENLVKGDFVNVEGKLKNESWMSNGEKKNKLVLEFNSIRKIKNPFEDKKEFSNPYKIENDKQDRLDDENSQKEEIF